ncbi:MAG TPA: efflux RND transporter permease subunit [Chitinophagaceae bacterium]|nr:efflux RND transporter permease subunit [Chitinophagaceae bacterium]
MWQRLGRFILQYRLPLLFVLIGISGFMAYHASRVQLSYDFSRAIPVDNPKYREYQEFRKQFGEEGNLLVIGFQTDSFFTEKIFNEYAKLQGHLQQIEGVDDVISVASAVNLTKDLVTGRLRADSIFDPAPLTRSQIDSGASVFRSLPFYRGLLHNRETGAWLMGIRINKDLMASKRRIAIVEEIGAEAERFSLASGLPVYKSGLPHIRTELSVRIVSEMRWFLAASVVLSAVILLLFFRSVTAMLLSLAVVGLGVTWSFAFIELFGYRISILNALIPPLIVVIGVPNCIYFLNKFHTGFNQSGSKKQALIGMVARMGIVTLFCNIAAAIGFAVFALTKSPILREFGEVAGVSIIALFFISLILIPAALSYLPAPKTRHTRYLHSPRMIRWLDRLERWSLNHRRLIYSVTVIVVVAATLGILRLKTEGYIVDDLPKNDKLYTDLQFFETHFGGVMPLEVVVDTKEKRGVTRKLANLQKIDSLSRFLDSMPALARPLSIVEGLKFAKQAFFEGDTASYNLPAEYDLPALAQYLNLRGNAAGGNAFSRLVGSFMDSNRQQARISVSMADVGTNRLPGIMDSISGRINVLFDPEKYSVRLTGTSVTFLEGSRFIINGLKESIAWAFVLIGLCMLYLFRSLRILICSLLPNVIPLVITAGVMGWAGVPLKPSTVLVFSVALGIAIDVTIRFLVNYKQELPHYNYDKKLTVIKTIHSTGISIIYTSAVLIAGFIIFCFSGFGGTKALGWLTSLTLITATVTNLVLLPAVLISLLKTKK